MNLSECELNNCFASTLSCGGQGVRCCLRTRGCPSPSLDGFSAPTSQQLQAYQRLVPLILPLALCSQEYQREGEVCPSVKSCSCQGCSQAITIRIQRQPEQLLLQPDQSQALCLLRHPRMKLCTAQPQPFPASPYSCLILLVQIHEKLHMCRELHYAGDVNTAVPALHEE